jgi:hypothetical protein
MRKIGKAKVIHLLNKMGKDEMYHCKPVVLEITFWLGNAMAPSVVDRNCRFGSKDSRWVLHFQLADN